MADEKHAFLSYVREDAAGADMVQAALESVGVKVWRDKDLLGPGDLWKKKIRDAIQGDALAFVALISTRSTSKERSYQRPELLLAAEEYQLHPPESHWMFVARLDDCPIPYVDLGGGRNLSELQWTDLYGDQQQTGLLRLTVAIRDLLTTQTSLSAPIADIVVARPTTEGGRVGTSIKGLLRDPNGDIELEEHVDEIAVQAAQALEDQNRFPIQPSAFTTSSEGVLLAERMLRDYEDVLEPLRECLTLAGTWARPANDRTWTRAMERIAAACLTPSSTGQVSTLLRGLRQYPLLWLSYAVTIASIERGNYSPSRAATLDARVEHQTTTGPLLAFLNPQFVFKPDWVGTAIATARDKGHQIDDGFVRDVELGRIGRRLTPASDILHDRLRPHFRYEFPSDSRYTEAFDRAAVLMDAVALDIRSRNSAGRYLPARPGFGSYTWRYQHHETPIESIVAGELTASSAYLAAGYFDGSFERASVAFNDLVNHAANVREQNW